MQARGFITPKILTSNSPATKAFESVDGKFIKSQNTPQHVTPIGRVLSDQQRAALSKVIDNKTICVIMGSAGTGKSEVLASAYEALGDRCMVITPTHKTKLALQEKGVEKVNLIRGLLKNKAVQQQLFDNRVTHILVDEAGMVDRSTQVQLESFIANGPNHSISVTYFGDPNQLEAISDNAVELENIWFDKVTPDFVLTTGYRQDANVILSVVKDTKINPNSVTICMTNDTRNDVNLLAHISKHGSKAFTSRKKAILEIHVGDTLICYETDSHQKYANNCVYTVRKVKHGHIDEKGKIAERGKDCFMVWFEGSRQCVIIEKSMFRVANHKTDEKRAWEFSYAITCHAAQGSGFDDVTVYVESNRVWDVDGNVSIHYGLKDTNIQKWIYTAITRGKKKITVVDSEGAIDADGISLSMEILQSFGMHLPTFKDAA